MQSRQARKDEAKEGALVSLFGFGTDKFKPEREFQFIAQKFVSTGQCFFGFVQSPFRIGAQLF